MAQVDITIQAATDAALTTLLMAHGVLVAGEGGVRRRPASCTRTSATQCSTGCARWALCVRRH